jgi:hypothetical protein
MRVVILPIIACRALLARTEKRFSNHGSVSIKNEIVDYFRVGTDKAGVVRWRVDHKTCFLSPKNHKNKKAHCLPARIEAG